MVTEALLTISDVAAETGLRVHTLRYYERIGLVGSVQREQNGHRRYTSDDERWIKLLICLRQAGMSIGDMQQMVQVRHEGDATGARARALFAKSHDPSATSPVECFFTAPLVLSARQTSRWPGRREWWARACEHEGVGWRIP